MTKQEIDKFLAIQDEQGRPVNNWKFGVELEYGGYANRLNYDPDDEFEIIEDIKEDGSVSGDGTEYNLKPLSYDNMRRNIPNLESFCYRAANKRCTLSQTAGMHVHMSWDALANADGRYIGRLMHSAIDKVMDLRFYITENIPYDQLQKFTKKFDSFIFKDSNALHNMTALTEKDMKLKKRLYEAFQFIYSTSNRSGTESYGLGSDYTRGYTRHGTIELRCWRTTLDYRTIIARVEIARFVMRYILKLMLYTDNRIIESADEIPSIWNEMIKTPRIRGFFEYLAFHVNNKHKVGCDLPTLLVETGTSNIEYAKEIARRSNLYQRAIKKTNQASKAKDLFKLVTSTDPIEPITEQQRGTEDESRVQNS